MDYEDFEFLMRNAAEGRALRLRDFGHLDQPLSIWNYIRIANDIAAHVPPARLLDWGCGHGQMTYLLRRRGFEVVAFDVGGDDKSLPDIPLCRNLSVIRTTHPTHLPFQDAAFDVVLSCGVLEHVDEFSEPGNERRSLQEIRRVLRPDGDFLIYQLPQRYSWTEATQRILRRGYFHPRRFMATEIRDILAASGYHIERWNRMNLLPKTGLGVPERIRALYSRFGRSMISLDSIFCRVPVLNQLAGVLELHARRVP
jgi:SAM-dependent methyltransferase